MPLLEVFGPKTIASKIRTLTANIIGIRTYLKFIFGQIDKRIENLEGRVKGLEEALGKQIDESFERDYPDIFGDPPGDLGDPCV